MEWGEARSSDTRRAHISSLQFVMVTTCLDDTGGNIRTGNRAALSFLSWCVTGAFLTAVTSARVEVVVLRSDSISAFEPQSIGPSGTAAVFLCAG